MQINEQQIARYVSLYQEVYGKSIDKSQARIELIALVCFLETVYQHINLTK